MVQKTLHSKCLKQIRKLAQSSWNQSSARHSSSKIKLTMPLRKVFEVDEILEDGRINQCAQVELGSSWANMISQMILLVNLWSLDPQGNHRGEELSLKRLECFGKKLRKIIGAKSLLKLDTFWFLYLEFARWNYILKTWN